MSEKYFLAVDIGASSGRHILGSLSNGKLVLEEIYRFSNGAVEKDGSLVWDTEKLFNDIIDGLKKCKELGKIPVSMGIDTWGVDYALLDKDDKLIGEVYSYRDDRTSKMPKEVEKIISEKEAYSLTGIQKQLYNTIYQLYSDKLNGKLKRARSFLMVPDYLHFLLTGVKRNEFTNGTTTGLINAMTRDWDYELIGKLGFDKSMFLPLSLPGDTVGNLKEEIAKEIGFNTKVCLPATHDTASAVMAVPTPGMPLYISSGTWSLMGIETTKALTNDLSRISGFTNEGGYKKSVTILKNIMGLWMIQNVRKEYDNKYNFVELAEEARKAKESGFNSLVEVNDMSFFAPKSMIQAIKDYCKKTNQAVPQTVGEVSYCVYASLAESYRESVEQMEKMTGKHFAEINIVGGGCQNLLLNELTAKKTGRRVVAGPVEATATGNIIAQMLAVKEIKNLDEGKEIIRGSFEIKYFD